MRVKIKGFVVIRIIRKIPSNYYWIITFLLGSLAMYVMLSYSQVLTTGKYVILSGDALEQFVAQIRMVVRSVRNGENPLVSATVSMGLNTIIPFAWHALSPFNILYLIFYNADMNIITAAVIILKIGTAAATFQLFSSKVLNNSGFFSIIFAIFYAMSGFCVTYGVYMFIWLDGVYILPVVALAVYIAVMKKNYIPLTIVYSYIFVVQFYMGYMVGIFSILFFIVLLISISRGNKFKDIMCHIGMYGSSVLISALISSIVWLPFALFLIKYRASDSTSVYSIQISLLEIVNNLFWGEVHESDYAPYIYCGIPSLILLPFYFLNKEISIKERVITGSLLIFFLLCCLIEPLFFFIHAFDVPDGFSFRFSFIISFIVCVMAVRVTCHIKTLNVKHILIFLSVLLMIYFVEMQLEEIRMGDAYSNTNLGFVINMLFAIIWIFACFGYVRAKDKTPYIAFLLLFTLVETITNGAVWTNSEASKENWMKEDYFYKWESDLKLALEKIDGIEESPKDNKDVFFRTIIYNDIIRNSDSYFGYNGVTDFETGENEALRHFLGNMGLFTLPRSTGGTGMTPSLSMLLSIKYSIKLYSELILSDLDVEPRVLENQYTLPLGFMVEDTAVDIFEMTSNTFENQNNVFRGLSGVGDIYLEVPEEDRYEEMEGLELWREGEGYFLAATSYGPGKVIYRTKDINNDVYIQIDSDEMIPGYFFSTDTQNMTHKREKYATVSSALKMWGSGTDHFIMTYTDSTFPNYIKINEIYEYQLDEDQLKRVYDSLALEQMVVEEYKSDYIKGHIRVGGNRRILFTSIPNTEGWNVYVNGKRAKITPVLNNVFLGVDLPENGEYTIEFKYSCPGLKMGAILSLTGITILVFFFLYHWKRKYKVTY